jgi:hypothetical protein
MNGLPCSIDRAASGRNVNDLLVLSIAIFDLCQFSEMQFARRLQRDSGHGHTPAGPDNGGPDILYLVAIQKRKNRADMIRQDQRLEDDPQHPYRPLRRPDRSKLDQLRNQ